MKVCCVFSLKSPHRYGKRAVSVRAAEGLLYRETILTQRSVNKQCLFRLLCLSNVCTAFSVSILIYFFTVCT